MLTRLLARWGTEGIRFFVAYDGDKPASARLLFMNVSFWLMLASLVLLHFKDIQVATWSCMGAYSLCTVFYLLKEVNKFKISKDQIDIEDTEEPK